MVQDLGLLLFAERLLLAAQHRRDVVAVRHEELVGRLRPLELVDQIHEVVFAQVRAAVPTSAGRRRSTIVRHSRSASRSNSSLSMSVWPSETSSGQDPLNAASARPR